MGLIQTAIMTGGGLYAVNKLAKTAEHRHSSKQSNPQYYARDNGAPSQAYWGPPGPAPRGPPQVDARFVEYQGQRQYYPENSPNDARYSRGYSAADYEEERYAPATGDNQYQNTSRQPIAPPSYYPQQGYVTETNDQVYDQNRGRGSPVAGLAGMAMQFVGNGGESGSKGKKLEKMSEFFRK